MTTDSFPLTGSLTQWIDQAQRGCPEAKKRVIHELHASIRELSRSQKGSILAPSKLSQSDIVQTALIRVIEHFDSFRGRTRSELRAWLSQIVVNEIRQANRRFRREIRDVRREKPIEERSSTNTIELASAQMTPAAIAVHDEQVSRMQAAIESLPEDQRRVIQLRSLELRSPKEIATMMGRSPEAVTKLWYRAVLKLQHILSQDNQSR
jgi:RNA polymerase sigma-70 factor, ECF subfamily